MVLGCVVVSAQLGLSACFHSGILRRITSVPWSPGGDCLLEHLCCFYEAENVFESCLITVLKQAHLAMYLSNPQNLLGDLDCGYLERLG